MCTDKQNTNQEHNIGTQLTEKSAPGNSPLQQLDSPLLISAGVELFIKRDDLLHPEFGGNKWRKLKYNLIHAQQNHFNSLLTFGGA